MVFQNNKKLGETLKTVGLLTNVYIEPTVENGEIVIDKEHLNDYAIAYTLGNMLINGEAELIIADNSPISNYLDLLLRNK